MGTVPRYAGELANLADEYAAKGRKEASQHRPPTDAVRPDQHEAELLTRGSKWLTSEQRALDSVLTDAQRAVVDIRQRLVELEHRTSRLTADTSLNASIDAEMSSDRRALVAATVSRLNAEVDLRAFRAENGITEQARYPESLIWHLGVVCLLALVETVVNAFFYSNEQGLLGGFIVALSIAAMNMGTALLLGAGFRYRNLAAIDKRVLGWTCLALFLVLTIFFNTLFATFRSEYQLVADPSNTAQLREAFSAAWGPAWRVFVLDLRFADMMSFILFGIGLLLSFAAFYKGMTFDDRYPGHGHRSRAVKAAVAEESRLQDELRDKVKAFLNKRRSELLEVAQEPSMLLTRTTTNKSEVQHARALLGTQTQAIQRDFALVVGAYRTANTAIRGTEPPAYFQEISNITTQVSDHGADIVIADLEQVHAEISSLRDMHQATVDAHLNRHHNNAAEVLKTTFNEFLLEVNREAKEKITKQTSTMHRIASGGGDANA